jgi:archaemetzincin
MDVKNKVYLAFINDFRPPFWKNLEKDMEVLYSPNRNQYHSTHMLSLILDRIPQDGDKIAGITDVDIYIPILTFLFGEAQLKGKGALVSAHRLDNEFYGLPPDDSLLYTRLLKELLHELGHAYGLVHCPNYACVMTSTSYVEGIDLKKAKYCRDCRGKIKAAFD